MSFHVFRWGKIPPSDGSKVKREWRFKYSGWGWWMMSLGRIDIYHIPKQRGK